MASAIAPTPSSLETQLLSAQIMLEEKKTKDPAFAEVLREKAAIIDAIFRSIHLIPAIIEQNNQTFYARHAFSGSFTLILKQTEEREGTLVQLHVARDRFADRKCLSSEEYSAFLPFLCKKIELIIYRTLLKHSASETSEYLDGIGTEANIIYEFFSPTCEEMAAKLEDAKAGRVRRASCPSIL